VGGPIHLVRRFLGSLSPAPLAEEDDRWATSQLGPGERRLWQQMSRADRKHSVGVARRVAARVGETDRAALAAALLHDVGKLEAGLGTFGRVAATLVGRERGGRWREASGVKGRIGRYLHHDAIGAALLEEAGADPLTVAWAREHHRPERDWSVPLDTGRALRAADDD
jgi:hypothetical protein